MVLLHSKKLVIQWYYEDDDEEIVERGEFISMTLDIPVSFYSGRLQNVYEFNPTDLIQKFRYSE